MQPSKVDFKQIKFLLSAPTLRQCPEDSGREVAFAGRSNAGKSSAINTLTSSRGLARTSKTPGRTQLINYFQLDPQRRLVDLPGYGYAKVPKAIKAKWDHHLAEYLQQRRSLVGLVLLMDIRHPLQAYDQQMLNWAAQAGLPTHILLTKADKLKRGPAIASQLQVEKLLRDMDPGCTLLTVQLFSSPKKLGVDALEQQLNQWLLQQNTGPATDQQ